MVDKLDTGVAGPDRQAGPGAAAPAGAVPTSAPVELTLEGTPRERGRRHGEALRGAIQQALDRWRAEVERDTAAPLEAYVAELTGTTSFVPAIQRLTPDLLDEVAGLGEGAGVPFPTMLAFQLVDEDWWFRRNRRYGVRLERTEKCSVVAAHDPGAAPLLAQNIDIPAWSDGLQVLLRIRDTRSGLETLVFSYAGLIGLGGVNSGPVAACVNALMQLDQRPDGLPVAFVVRGILERPTLAEAERFVFEVPHASGQAYTVGGPARAAGLECSARSVRPYPAAAGTRRLFHTNHPLACEDQAVFRRLLDRLPADQVERSRANSERRLASCARRLGDGAEPADVAAIKNVLRSHDDPAASICAHGGDGTMAFTAWSVIYELTPTPTVLYTCGPPCRTDYRAAGFGWRRP